jgi:hypothetical protein
MLLVIAGVVLGYYFLTHYGAGGREGVGDTSTPGSHYTSPSSQDVDTDGDGLRDVDEVEKYGTSPYSRDTDNDGLSDYDEIFTRGTDPLKADTDGDGIDDYKELFLYGTDPLKKDTDEDGLTDHDEVSTYHTDPSRADTDEDGIGDYEEVFIYKTSPLKKDTDEDGLDDYREIFVYGTSPLKADTDEDGISDYQEILVYGTDPLRGDTDGDGILDGDEVLKYGTDPLKLNPNVKYALDRGLADYLFLVKPLDEDEVQDENEREFIELLAGNKRILFIPVYTSYLWDKASDGRISDEELARSIVFSQFVSGLYDVVINTWGIRNYRGVLDYSSSLGLRLGFDGEVAGNATVKAVAYYGVAVVDRGLPEDFDEISLLVRATRINGYGDKLVDFSPIVFHSVYGNHFLYPDVGRETWMLAKHLKMIMDTGFNILGHPEMFEALNVKIIANAYSIFDAPYGVSYAEKFINGRTLKPTDQDVWDLIMLQWNLYSNKAPQLGGGDKLYNRDFPWYDSDKLDLLYQDANNRRQALFFLFFIDNATFDMKQGEAVAGLEGARRALIQAEEHYNIVSSLYPDGKVRHEIWGDVPAWWFYYDWIEDRGVDRLENTHLQYVGLKPLELWKIMTEDPDNVWNRIKDLNGVDQFITKNWDYWHLMKFAMGYERWNDAPGMLERHTINYMIPQILRAFGFPTYFVRITPNPVGTAVYEWVVSLPDYVAEKLRAEFGDRIIIGPANGFGLYLCKEGLLEDGVKEISGFSGGSYLYRARDGTIKVGFGLALNFRFYFVKKP